MIATFRAMNTTVEVLDAPLPCVVALFSDWHARLSRFDPDSELSLLNAATGRWFAASRVLWEVLGRALYWAGETALFDPTIIDGLPTSHPLFSEELFVPLTVVGEVMTLDEGIDLANSTEYGLTAGIFSEDDREIEQFFNRIQAGVTYVNRRAGATTGAWPGINSFGGWKASGSTGRGTGGPYYVQQFMREQSRVRIR